MRELMDCEAVRDGFLGQPVNAITSLALVVAGGAVLFGNRTWPWPTGRRWFGALLIATGIASALFHGPWWAGARFVHDATILATVGFMVEWRLGRLVPRSLLLLVASLVSVVAAVAALAFALLVAAVIAIEVGAVRSRNRPALAAAAIGAGAWLAGRTGSPLCDPDSVVQLHGLWHVLAAIAFWLWWRGVSGDELSGRLT